MSTTEGIVIEGVKNRISEFLEEHYEDELEQLSEEQLKQTIEIDYELLEEFDETLAEDLANTPDQWISNCEAAIEEYNDDIESFQILITNYQRYNPSIRNLRDKHLGKLVRLDGTVSKATDILPKADVAAFECQVCGEITKIKQPLDSDLEYPDVCSGDDCDNRSERRFKVNPTLSETINFRKIEIQEPPEDTSGGQTPETQTFTVEGEIADNINAGNNVTATGVYRASDQGDTSIFRTYVKGINIIPEEQEFEELEITEEDKKQIQELSQKDNIYQTLIDSVAPNLYGLEKEKEAVLYQLFRGVRKTKMEGSTVRGDIHVLLVGDPGVGKTIHESSIIIGKNGNPKKIGEFVEEHMDDPEVDENGDLIEKIDKNVKVMAMDKDGEIEPKDVKAVWKKKPEKTYRVELSDGREITTSETHPLFTPDGDAHIQQQKVGEIDEGEFVAVPRRVEYEGTYELDALESYNVNECAHKLEIPNRWTEELAELLGLIVGEGTITDHRVKIDNNDKELIDKFVRSVNSLGLHNVKHRFDDRSDTPVADVSSVNLVNLLEEIDDSIRNKSRNKRVPKPVFSSPKDIRKSFLKTYIDGEAHISSQGNRGVSISSMSKELLRDVQLLLDSIGIYSQLNERENKSVEGGVSYNLRIYGKEFEKYVKNIGFESERKQNRAVENIKSSDAPQSNVDVVPRIKEVIHETRKLLGMTPSDFESNVIRGIEYEDNDPLRDSVKRLVRDMVGRLRILRGFEKVDKSELTWSVVDEYRKFASLSQEQVAEELGYSLGWYRDRVEYGKSDPHTQKTIEAYESVKQKIDEDLRTAHENLIRLESLAWGDIRWVEVDSIEQVESDSDWMYDIEIEETHNYIANGIMSHNSQLLRYASKLAPRGVMTSGKGASEAGLCVGPETTVSINGEERVIEDLVRSRLPESVSKPTAVEVGGIKTVSVDVGRGITESDVTHLWRMPEQDGVKISLWDGSELVVSLNTPLITGYSDGRYVWTDAGKIRVGDRVGVFPETGDLDEIYDGQITWSEVENVEEVVTEMFDMTTDQGNFYANGVVAHNTAAAVRDSEFGGDDKWTLKAGALVLADQGLACVDEIDKMDSSDRSAMHEGLEQQTVSISKAGINSTLKSRCTLLAAANPKDGRWNDFDPVPAQINLEPALVSRFDLIFAPEDKRDKDRDSKLADHILQTNLRGQQMEAGMDPDEETEDVEPEISPELFKKYVAHARQKKSPVMTDEAMDFINDFFVNIRAEGEQEGAIPVTARKIEGIVRLSEAVARIQLSDTVEIQHAERAKDIVMSSLKDVGYDEEAGRFDVDMTETNQSTSQRDRRNMLIQVIEENEDEGEKGAPKDLVIEIMTDKGYDEDKVDYDLRQLGRSADEVYEPTSGEYATL